MKQSAIYQFKKSGVNTSDFFVCCLIILFCLGPTTSSLAQEDEKPSLFKRIFTRPGYDSNYVESYYHFLHVTLVAVNQNHRTSISSPDPNVTVSVRPNTMTTYGFGLDYKFLTIELTRAIDAISKPEPSKGESKSYSFRLGYTGRRILGSALIQSHSGMYISNPDEFMPNWNVQTQGYPKRPDIKSTVLFGSLNYFFNHTRYSTMASLWQIDRQKKSAGSWVAGITASLSSIKGDTALIPPLPPSITSETGRLVSGTNYLTGINFGYCHNFIYRKIFFNINLIPGINIQFGEYQTDNLTTKTAQTNVGLHGDFRATTGYNGERYYWGAYYSNYLIHNPISEFIELNQFNSYFRLFIGRRFDLRKKHP
jgi:hypothetical protein